MKRTLIAAAILFAATAAHAQNTATTLASQVQISPSKTVDIANAREIGTNPGNQYVIDRNGVLHAATFASTSVIFGAAAFQDYAQVSPGVFRNVSATNAIECAQTGTLVTWASGAPQTFNDGCAFNDAVKVRARRI